LGRRGEKKGKAFVLWHANMIALTGQVRHPGLTRTGGGRQGRRGRLRRGEGKNNVFWDRMGKREFSLVGKNKSRLYVAGKMGEKETRGKRIRSGKGGGVAIVRGGHPRDSEKRDPHQIQG